MESLLADAAAGRLPTPTAQPEAIRARLDEQGVSVVDWSGWRLIDDAEREQGSVNDRPRVKVVDRAALLTAAGVAS